MVVCGHFLRDDDVKDRNSERVSEILNLWFWDVCLFAWTNKTLCSCSCWMLVTSSSLALEGANGDDYDNAYDMYQVTKLVVDEEKYVVF